MDILEFREFCLSLPCTTEEMPFGDDTLVFKVGGKVFAACSVEFFDRIAVKCDPERAILLREQYAGISAAWHFNKRHWNDLSVGGDLPDKILHDEIRHSYMEVLIHNVSPASRRREILAAATAAGLHTAKKEE